MIGIILTVVDAVLFVVKVFATILVYQQEYIYPGIMAASFGPLAS